MMSRCPHGPGVGVGMGGFDPQIQCWGKTETLHFYLPLRGHLCCQYRGLPLESYCWKDHRLDHLVITKGRMARIRL